MTRKNQSGMSIIGMALSAVLMGAALLVFLKVVPAVSEYMGVRRAISAVASGADPTTATVSQLRDAFTKRARIDDITSIDASELDITKEDGKIVITASYSRKIPLVSNVSLLIDFYATSAPTGR